MQETIKKRGKTGKIIISIIILAILAGAGIRMVGNKKPWTSVFLANGQVYFGKLSVLPLKSTVTLKDIYYLQVRQVLQPAENPQEPQQQISLAKLGNELHGPEDRMTIPKNQILFWEKMKEDSQVVQAIERYRAEQE